MQLCFVVVVVGRGAADYRAGDEHCPKEMPGAPKPLQSRLLQVSRAVGRTLGTTPISGGSFWTLEKLPPEMGVTTPRNGGSFAALQGCARWRAVSGEAEPSLKLLSAYRYKQL